MRLKKVNTSYCNLCADTLATCKFALNVFEEDFIGPNLICADEGIVFGQRLRFSFMQYKIFTFPL